MLTFDSAFDRLLGHEGRYSNNPKDPGGETKWGISKRSYPRLIIKELTREDAKNIYLRDFWLELAADHLLHDSIAWQLFDFAVNSGIQTAIRYYQRALGVADDGHFGPVSTTAAYRMGECDQLLLLNSERLEYMTKLSNWPDASKGWARRIAGNLRYGSRDNDLATPLTAELPSSTV